jgi:hypothetical protein
MACFEFRNRRGPAVALLITKKPRFKQTESEFFYYPGLVPVVVLGEAFAAVDRAVAPGLEGYLRGCTAGCTGGIVHFPRASGVASETAASLLLAGCPALGTAAWLIGEPLLSIKLLLRCTENEFIVTVTTC